MSSDAFMRHAPSPRDHVIGGLIELRATDDPSSIATLLPRLQGWVYETSVDGGLYGMPGWLTDLSHLEELIDGDDEPTRAALAEVRRRLAQSAERERHTDAESPSRRTLDRAYAYARIQSHRPVHRDEGWRHVRTDVPVVFADGGDGPRSVLIGLQVEVAESGPAVPADGIVAAPGTMDLSFRRGVIEGRDAALSVLREAGFDDSLLSRLQRLFVRPLGVPTVASGQELLTGRSAGLPVALTVLQRAGELAGRALPPMDCVASGVLNPRTGLLESLGEGLAQQKLDAVLVDGRSTRLICPFVADDRTHEPLPREQLPSGLNVAIDLREAAEAVWGDAWEAWIRRPTLGQVADNLPSPTYDAYVSSPEVEQQIADGLASRRAIVTIEGESGVGKSTIAHELSASMLRAGDHRFDAIVWVTDEAQPGTTTLEGVLDEIAALLGYSRVGMERADMRHVLRMHPILLTIDSFQTVRDPALTEWLRRLPEDSKAVLTTRPGALPKVLVAHAHRVPVMRAESGDDFVRACLDRLGLQDLEPAFVSDIQQVTGGNRKGVELALGYVGAKRRTPGSAVAALRQVLNAGLPALAAHNYETLTQRERTLLLATALHPYGATVDDLAVTAGVAPESAATALDRIRASGLLDVTQESGAEAEARLFLAHGIVRPVVEREFAQQEAFSTSARERWLARQRGVAVSVGFCPDDVERLRRLDANKVRSTLIYAAEVAFELERHEFAIEIAREARYYFYVRGLRKDGRTMNGIWASAARAVGNVQEEFDALTYEMNVLAKQGERGEAQALSERLRELETAGSIAPDSLGRAHHAEALLLLARRDYTAAERIWTDLLATTDRADDEYSPRARWLAICVHRRGQPQEARRLAEEALAHARSFRLARAEVATRLHLIELDLDAGELDACDARIEEVAPLVGAADDAAYTADFVFFRGRAAARHDQLAAAQHLGKAIERYRRLGRVERIEEARRLLAGLKEAR